MRPILDRAPYPWAEQAALELHRTLYKMIPQSSRALVVASSVGIDTGRINADQPPYDLWKDLLELSASSQKTRALISSLRSDPGLAAAHPIFNLLLEAPTAFADNEPSGPDGRLRFLPAHSEAYLRWVEQQTRFLEIPSFTPKLTRRIRIEEVFVDLQSRDRSGDVLNLSSTDYVTKHSVEQRSRIVLLGRSASGKTTYLRRVANEHSQLALRGLQCFVPLYCRATELAQHINKCISDNVTQAPAFADSEAWLSHFFSWRAGKYNAGGLPPSFFEDHLLGGTSIILVDAVDEVTNRSFTDMIVHAADSYPHCPMVVATRPAGLRTWNESSGFRTTEILPLERSKVRTFIQKWSTVLYSDRPDIAQSFANESIRALKTRQDPVSSRISPGVLTTLLTVWSGTKPLSFRLVRAYEELLLGSLSSLNNTTRKHEVLQDLALEMQRSNREQITSAPIDWAEQQIAQSLGTANLEPAREFLLRTEEAAGLVVVSDESMRFWHSLFQDFLVARALSRRLEAEQDRILGTAGDHLLDNNWRQPLLFLSEILSIRNPERIKGVLALIAALGNDNSVSKIATKMTLMHEIATRMTNPAIVKSSREYRTLFEWLMPLVFSERITELDAILRTDLARCYSMHQDPRLSALDWVPVSAGSFYMGAQSQDPAKPKFDRNARSDERPVRLTAVADFEITRFPITVGQYQAFIDERGYVRQEFWQAGGFDRFRSPSRWIEQRLCRNLPVVGVSWYEANAFCYWAGGQLPTERQWERTAAGLEGRIYPWGNSQPDLQYAAFGSDRSEVTPAGLFPEGSTPDRVFDLAGNAWEWTRDAYTRYGTSQTGATSANTDRKVLRGGSVLTAAHFLRCSTRISAQPNDRYSNFGPIGFRCVRHMNKSA